MKTCRGTRSWRKGFGLLLGSAISLGVISCRPWHSSDSDPEAYSREELQQEAVKERIRDVAQVLKESGWCSAPMFLNQESVRDHNELIAHMTCIANAESSLGNDNYGWVGGDNCTGVAKAVGLFQIMHGCHAGDGTTYEGKTYSCPSVSREELASNDVLNGKCALKAYVEARGIRPWEGICAYGRQERQRLFDSVIGNICSGSGSAGTNSSSSSPSAAASGPDPCRQTKFFFTPHPDKGAVQFQVEASPACPANRFYFSLQKGESFKPIFSGMRAGDIGASPNRKEWLDLKEASGKKLARYYLLNSELDGFSGKVHLWFIKREGNSNKILHHEGKSIR